MRDRPNREARRGGRTDADPYVLNAEGIFVPPFKVVHRSEDYDEGAFDVLAEMQDRHFWYRARHRVLLRAWTDALGRRAGAGRPLLSVIDLGGGCGGWLSWLAARWRPGFRELALADSSLIALRCARAAFGDALDCYQADLMDLRWRDRWDAAFLLDVIEHLSDDAGALRQVRAALKPGGLLFVTTPALPFFQSYNDAWAGHKRRYTRADFGRLAAASGLRLLRARYFMFSTSPAYLLRRLAGPQTGKPAPDEILRHLARTHRVPPAAVNEALNGLLAAEELLGRAVPYPWGTSLLGVFAKD